MLDDVCVLSVPAIASQLLTSQLSSCLALLADVTSCFRLASWTSHLAPGLLPDSCLAGLLGSERPRTPRMPFRPTEYVNLSSREVPDPSMMSKAYVVGGFLGDFVG